ncbi:MAG: hypothetical protein D6692_04480, partial [Planctomycetota bacterium]
TLRATIDSEVAAGYLFTPTISFGHTVPVTDRDPDKRRTLRLRLRVRVHLEPYLDTGYVQVTNDPSTPGPIETIVGAGDGAFSFQDDNGNGVHDPGEPSEPYLDFSSGVLVNTNPATGGMPLEEWYKPGNEAPNTNGNGRGPVASTATVLAELERANIAWAQAGIKVVIDGGIIIEEAPTGADGLNILSDGWFSLNGLVIDAVATITSIGQLATPSVAEVVFTGPLTFIGSVLNAAGFAFIPWLKDQIGMLPSTLKQNTYMFISPAISLGQRALAHEIGHALTNQPDTFFTPSIFFPSDEPAPDDLAPHLQRRILHSTEMTARTPRPTACLGCSGNMLVAP